MSASPEYRRLFSPRGNLSYRPRATDPPLSSYLDRHTTGRRFGRIYISRVDPDAATTEQPQKAEPSHFFGKLAGPRDSALRFLRSIVPQAGSDPKVVRSNNSSQLSLPNSVSLSRGEREEMPLNIQYHDPPYLDSRHGSTSNISSSLGSSRSRSGSNAASITTNSSRGGNLLSTSMHRPYFADAARERANSTTSIRSRTGSVTATEDLPVASGNGISIQINLTEPVLFLQGYDSNDTSSRSTAMLRGSMVVKVQKSAKLKAVTLKFRGVATTKWPEGIPPKKTEIEEAEQLMNHTWTFFNAQFPIAEGGSGADSVKLAQPIPANTTGKPTTVLLSASPVESSIQSISREARKLSLQNVQSRSFEKGASSTASSVSSKGYRTFHPGEYTYNFELPIDSRLPETINVELGSVRYDLEATIERAGAFKANLQGAKEVTMIRVPGENSLEQVEPIAISRNWEDQLHYDIVISGKSFPLGAKVPIAFKLTPLAKVQCHRIKVLVTENTEYYCHNKRVHRMEPTRNIQLFEKRANCPSKTTYPGSTIRVTAGGGIPYDLRVAAAAGEEISLENSTNLLGQLDSESNVGPTEMEFNVQLPGCHDILNADRNHKLHFDTTYSNIQVHHWIKIVMRLSKPDLDNPEKRRHFEISIDSPFHILSCQANSANTALPAYSQPNSIGAEQSPPQCNCLHAPSRRPSHIAIPPSEFGTAATENASNLQSPHLARPQQAHVHGEQQRPIHLVRAPSFGPPAWSDEDPPPPLVTPPPQYDDIASPSTGLADYFSRLADAYDDESDDETRAAVRGRVNVPLTPGSRVSRSMDLGRNWVPVTH